jgi:hypothetical protein
MNASRSFAPRDTASLTFLILAGAAVGMACLLALLPAAGHDQMWLLYAAKLMLRGQPLYGPTIFETNPPLILWMSAIPAALANRTHLPDTAWGKLCVALMLAGVAALCLRLYGLARPQVRRAHLAALLFAFITIFAVMPARDFGQRDHLLALLILPYIVAAAVRGHGLGIPPRLAILTGLLALAGLALKPHQVLIPLFIETALLLWQRPRGISLLRLEFKAMVCAGMVFLAAVWIFAPMYFTVVTPLARETYWAYGGLTWLQLVKQSIQLHLLLVLDSVLILRRGASRLTRMLALGGLAATCAFYLQGTGWYYQQLPALTLLGFALVVELLDLYAGSLISLPRWTPSAAAALSALALVLTAHFTGYPFTAARSFPVDTPAPALFAGLGPGTAVMTISPTVDDTIQPIYKYGLTLGQRYPAFLMLPALLRAEEPEGSPIPKRFTPADVATLDAVQHSDMVADLERWHPQMILVERCQDPQVHCQVLEERHDNLLAWFLRDPAFAVIFAHYHLAASSGPYDAYRLNLDKQSSRGDFYIPAEIPSAGLDTIVLWPGFTLFAPSATTQLK